MGAETLRRYVARAQVFGMAPGAIPQDGQGLAVEPERPGSDMSKRINAVIGCGRTGFRVLVYAY